ncbi:hypothetical protein SY83_18935 [Paenibacillus swuensis]|uniref:Sporulation protein Spo0E n=1 Tax=Paenibacillus swuensis TaxID=1178515 RepID=A0A172TM86_9BACL|nr:aspartyl-phosphate phosphatase Spo0E family protein [Paenibacillus swuensis]ANE48024.1 hypothetical protein SY83_18935 [Paenibacillus swuensis]
MERDLNKIIDILRQQMVDKAMETGNFTDLKVVELSQQLDFFIYQLQLLHSQKRKQCMFGLFALLSGRNGSVSAVC